MTAISVAMATFNGAEFIGEQLASLAAQTVLPRELVVRDDGSTDDTLDIVRAFATTAPFEIRILDSGPRLGFADNFLRSAEACCCPLVAFCDQDDVWSPRKLEIGASRLHRDGSVMSMHQLTMTDEMLTPIGIWTQAIRGDDVHDPLAIDPYINGWGNTMLFDRSLLDLLPAASRPVQPESPHRPLSHDTWVYVLAAAFGRISHIAQPLILYRQHGRNAIGLAPKRSGWRERLTDPSWRLQQRTSFSRHLWELFEGLSATTSDGRAVLARAAADRYALRSQFFQHRIDVYSGLLPSRVRAYTRLLRFQGDTPYGANAKLRDGVFGLLKLSRFLPKEQV